MNPDTGHIHFGVPEVDAKKRGLVPIPDEDIERVVNMNRKQRRAWAAQQRKRSAVLPSDTKGSP